MADVWCVCILILQAVSCIHIINFLVVSLNTMILRPTHAALCTFTFLLLTGDPFAGAHFSPPPSQQWTLRLPSIPLDATRLWRKSLCKFPWVSVCRFLWDIYRSRTAGLLRQLFTLLRASGFMERITEASVRGGITFKGSTFKWLLTSHGPREHLNTGDSRLNA